jgi:hypothetical protein
MTSLADRQAALVAALVAGADVPEGFDVSRVLATRLALMRKRAGEVAGTWPLLAASYGESWFAEFSTWAAARPPAGSLRDGWDFARDQGDALPALGKDDLADRERHFHYDGRSAPRRRSRAAVLAATVRSRLWISDWPTASTS